MGLAQTPPEGRFSTQNSGPVKFEAPRVPVIFVLGKYSKIRAYSLKVINPMNLISLMLELEHS